MKMLFSCADRLRRKKIQHVASKAIRRMPPITEPTTIPAIWPRDRPLSAAAVVLVAEAVPPAEDVEVGNRGGMEENVGRVTPSHRFVTLELMQQESVAFGELDAQ